MKSSTLATRIFRLDGALVIEVSDSSLAHDRGIKGRVYAKAGISEYWIINVPARQVEVYSKPLDSKPLARYESRVDFNDDDTIPVTVFGQIVGKILVKDLLPER